VTSLRAALRRDNDTLKRRKVKVELWVGYMGSAEEELPKPKLMPYDGPLNEEGPFKARITNLDRHVSENDLGYFFWDRACEPTNLKFGKPLPKHTAEVDFADQKSLRTALGLNGAIFKGREILVELWDTTEKRKPEVKPVRDREEGEAFGRSWRDEATTQGERPRPKQKPREGEKDWRQFNVVDQPPKSTIGRVAGGKETRADKDDNWRRS